MLALKASCSAGLEGEIECFCLGDSYWMYFFEIWLSIVAQLGPLYDVGTRDWVPMLWSARVLRMMFSKCRSRGMVE